MRRVILKGCKNRPAICQVICSETRLLRYMANFIILLDQTHYSKKLRLLRLLITLCLLLITVFTAHAQSLRVPVSSAYQLLNAYSKTQSDVFSFTGNTAALAQQKGFGMGVFGESRFLTREVNHYSAAAGFETVQGNFGVQADYFGFTQFNEYQLGAAYARSLGANFDLGVQFNYYAYRIPAYQQQSTVTFQIGAIGRLTETFSIAVQVYNPVGGYLSKQQEEKLPSNYQFGAAYEPTKNMVVSATMQKEEGRDMNITAGVFYQFDKQFFARAGVRTENNMPFAAAGIAFSDMRLDISVSHHAQLGFSPGVMLIYQPQKPDR